VVEYLRAYAAQHEVTPRFGVEVRHIRRTGGHFEVETNQGLLKPRFVVVATGYNRVASRPALKGLERFEGRVIHSGQYKNPEPYALKRTLVVGCGNSGAEIALDLAEHGVEVAMVVRGPVHVVPRDLFGRSTQETGILLSFLPLAWRDALITAVLRLAVGDLSRWGIVRPRLGPHQTILQTGRIPLLDIGTIAKVKEGKIRVLPGVEEVLGEQVRFADGSTHPFEAIILATGYTPALAGLIGGFEAIADPRGRPHRFGEETRIPDLFFVGFKNPPTGALREIALEAPRVAEAIRQKV
jgi:NADPH-dependent glutamate synthase beta subunit-like oxidoreductase